MKFALYKYLLYFICKLIMASLINLEIGNEITY